MVGTLVSAAPAAVGDVFRMDMTWRDGPRVERYQSDNHITIWEPPTRISWATALPDGQPLGWTWTYELQHDRDQTIAILIYDWTQTPDDVIRRFGVPLADERSLARSLALLANAVEATGTRTR